MEVEAIADLKSNIRLAESELDYVSRDLFLSILASEEKHIDWLETQLGLINSVGIQNYLQSQIDPDKGAD